MIVFPCQFAVSKSKMYFHVVFYVCAQLKVHTKLANGEDFDFDITLSHPIMPDQTTTKVMASKVSSRKGTAFCLLSASLSFQCH